MTPEEITDVEQKLGRTLTTEERLFGELGRPGFKIESSFIPKMFGEVVDPIELELMEARKRIDSKRMLNMTQDEQIVWSLEDVQRERKAKAEAEAANAKRAETVQSKLTKLEQLREAKKWSDDWSGHEWTQLRDAITQGQSVAKGGDAEAFEGMFRKIMNLAQAKKTELERAIDLKRLEIQAQLDRLESEKKLLRIEIAPVETQPVDVKSSVDRSEALWQVFDESGDVEMLASGLAEIASEKSAS